MSKPSTGAVSPRNCSSNSVMAFMMRVVASRNVATSTDWSYRSDRSNRRAGSTWIVLRGNSFMTFA